MKFILESKPKVVNYDLDIIQNIETKIKNNYSLTKEEISIFLDYLCYEVRCKFTNDFDNYSFEFKCDVAQSIICHYLNDLGVINHPNSTQKSITNNIVGHSFVVAEFIVTNTLTPYLIDPTYRQFFLEEKCIENKYLEQDEKIFSTPDPGFYIKNDDKLVVSNFLHDGYAKLNENISRIYGDSFFNTKTISYDKKFKSIPGNIYIKSFLKGNEKLSKSKDELGDMVISVMHEKRI